VRRLRRDLRIYSESSIDWSQFDLATPEVMELKDHKELRDHQTLAGDKVREGFTTHEHGKLIMACGTGKTFTSPRIYDDASKAKAGQAQAVLASMDDERTYGPEFHRCGVGCSAFIAVGGGRGLRRHGARRCFG